MSAILFVVALALGDGASASDATAHFDVTARFEKTPSGPEIAVTFAPRSPEVHINQNPAPRLRLADDQKVLVAKPVSRPSESGQEKPAGYLDTSWPVVFPVTLAAGAPKGAHTVKGSVTYYYCSKRDGWCRKGSADVDVPVTVP